MRSFSKSPRALLAALFVVMIAPAVASAQVSIPHQALSVPINSLADEEVILLDMGTIVERPEIFLDATPDASHPDLELEIEFGECTFFQDENASCPPDVTSATAVGPNSVRSRIWTCNPEAPFPNETCEVTVRVLDFGAAGAPANVDISVRAETRVPNASPFIAVDTTLIPVQVQIPRWRDTTIYEQDPMGSNGQGQYIWAGERVTSTPPFGFLNFYDLHGLISFDVTSAVPATATIDDVEIEMHVESVLSARSGVTAHLEAVSQNSSPFGTSQWNSGDADAVGNEIAPGVSTVSGANWTHRTYPFGAWNTPGADVEPGILASAAVGVSPGYRSFQSPALTDAVRTMHATTYDRDGFRITATATSPSLSTEAVQFASGEFGDANVEPMMIIDYTPASAPPQAGTFASGTVAFIGEGENLRWIYDTNNDDIIFTSIDGRCEITDPSAALFIPYNYEFQGTDQAYQGLDCCTWQIDSAATNTVGTGQAIFFINLDPGDPANHPGDIDGDGIRDLCDNCPYTPNGPLLGTCIGGANDGQICNAAVECGTGFCSLSQQDTLPVGAAAPPGDACPVPEPSSLPMLAAGGAMLFAFARRRRP